MNVEQRKRLLKVLIWAGVYPNIFLKSSPLKIYEFFRLRDLVPLLPGDAILDLGCGQGAQTLLLAKRCASVTGVDIATNAIEVARYTAALMKNDVRADFICAQLENAGLDGGAFHKIYSFSVLEHIDNYREVLAECLRLLKPGGHLIFSVDALETIKDTELLELHKQKRHISQLFTRDSLSEELENLGFEKPIMNGILSSDFARRYITFLNRHGWRNPKGTGPLFYLALKFAESFAAGQDQGLFLVGSCRKPE